MIIYKITNLINNKIYIGQTRQKLSKRWGQHNETRKDSVISNAIQKYGKQNFSIEQIDSAETQQDLNIKEIYWIAYFNTLDPKIGYNRSPGGDSYVMTEEQKTKISSSKKGVPTGPKSEKGKENMRAANKTADRSYITTEWKNQISIIQKKRLENPEYINKLRNAKLGKKPSDESRKKMSESQKGKCNTLGKTWKLSEETKQRVKELKAKRKKDNGN